MDILNNMEVVKTSDYFNLSIDELTVDENGQTKEEKLLHDLSTNVTFFDSVSELSEEKNDFLQWLEKYSLKIKMILQTVNERIAVIPENN